MKTFTLVALLAAVTPAFAHYRFHRLVVGGQVQPEWKYIRKWVPEYNNGPVEDVSSVALRCNVNAQPAPETVTVNAGDTIGFAVDQKIIHPGPYAAYLARAPGNVASWDGSGNGWFKIWEKGPTVHTSTTLQWDESSTQWTFQIPRSTPSGQYLLRFEHIGLHGASNYPGAQVYPACAQVNIVNGGNGNPGPTVSIPGSVYNGQHPGIKINIYWPIPATYVMPGPAVWRG